ncbi:hypothetical protein C8R45DRAFT_985825, partial [Mycena sanguinolenta]
KYSAGAIVIVLLVGLEMDASRPPPERHASRRGSRRVEHAQRGQSRGIVQENKNDPAILCTSGQLLAHNIVISSRVSCPYA